ncbi:pif1 [Symbiodinium sp. CCMP2592]|nr:pif1 [Symbiodinium sp. CCMP2592]
MCLKKQAARTAPGWFVEQWLEENKERVKKYAVSRCDGDGFLVCLGVCEDQLFAARQFFPLLDYWVGRGLLHLFIALQMLGMNDLEEIDADEGVKTFVEASSLALLAIGGFFTAGAFLCFGPLERRQQRLATRKEEVMRELTDLERRKKALETEAGL